MVVTTRVGGTSNVLLAVSLLAVARRTHPLSSTPTLLFTGESLRLPPVLIISFLVVRTVLHHVVTLPPRGGVRLPSFFAAALEPVDPVDDVPRSANEGGDVARTRGGLHGAGAPVSLLCFRQVARRSDDDMRHALPSLC